MPEKPDEWKRLFTKFFDSECFIDYNQETNASTLYNAFVDWLKQNKYQYYPKMKAFGIFFKEQYPKHSKKRYNNGYRYRGICVKKNIPTIESPKKIYIVDRKPRLDLDPKNWNVKDVTIDSLCSWEKEYFEYLKNLGK